MNTKVKIGGAQYTIEIVDDKNKVCLNNNNKNNTNLLGDISYSKQCIRVLKLPPERELRLIIFEILKCIIHEYNIRELIDDNGNHLTIAIDQLSIGLGEALESVGVTKIAE